MELTRSQPICRCSSRSLTIAALLVLWATLAGATPRRYFVELASDPLALHPAVQGRRDALRSAPVLARRTGLRAEQRRARVRVESLGAVVLGSTETVANALLVRAEEDQADALAAIPGVKRVQPVRRYALTLDHAIPLHKVPDAWNRVGVDKAGAGIKIAII